LTKIDLNQLCRTHGQRAACDPVEFFFGTLWLFIETFIWQPW